MVLSRRQTLRAAGTAAVAALAGCATDALGNSGQSTREYRLHLDRIDASPVEYALYEPERSGLFAEPERTALEEILPTGRYTTYGYQPLPSDEYVEHEGTYFQTKGVVTGRKRIERQMVRVETVAKERVPDDAVLIDSLERPSARVLKILHSYTQTDGETSTADLLRGDAYVLRRPREVQSRLADGDLDGRVVTMTESGAWAYRVRVTRERIVEPAHTVLAVEVADSPERFRDVVFGSRIDAELAPSELSTNAREILEEAIGRGEYAAAAPLSAPFDALLDALGLGTVDRMANGKLLWYDSGFYRYGLYVDEDSS